MEEFYVKVYLFKPNRVPPIKIARNSKLKITIETMDYTIPNGSTASAFSKGAFSDKVYTQSCTVDGNRISFTPMPGFFVNGRNVLQYEIGGGVIPLALDVNCELSLPDSVEAVEPDTVKPYVLRAEEAAKKAEGILEDIPNIIDEKVQSDITEQVMTEWGFTKNTGDYTKPESGIPESDLAQEVRDKLNNAPTLEDVPGNLVLYEAAEGSEDEQTIEALMMDKLTLEADGTYIYLKFGETVLGMVEAGSGGGETIYCTGIVIDQEAFTVDVSDTASHTLTATVSPADCTQIIRWSSSDPNVVQVASTGALTVVGEGSATITAKCGTQSDSVAVTVVNNSVTVYFGYCANWFFGTPSSPLLGENSARGYCSRLSSDALRKQTGNTYDSDHQRSISIEPGSTYRMSYTGTDTTWYLGYAILSDTEIFVDSGWKNIGTLKEITVNNSYDSGIYLYMNLKYGSAGSAEVTEALLTEFISNFKLERVV